MNIIDIINKKRKKEVLNREELEFAFLGYLNNKVKDYQMSSLLMAICINGMDDPEIYDLVDIFIKSGETLDLSSLSAITVDKHSTGGVGDKTTLIIAPIVASCGVIVPKMSGRGLGHTGGTIDKLESIPHFRVNLNRDEFLRELREIGMSVISQTANLAPLDKVIYALRDVTGTVESIPLIATSIMSKKIASGTSKILIDIKVGSGALIKTKEDAEKLRSLMIKIGSKYGKEVRCIINDMNTPLGRCIGNSLEICEAIEVLQGKVNNNLVDVCIDLATNMISMGKNVSLEEARFQAEDSIKTGRAYKKFYDFVRYQDGDLNALQFSKNIIEVKSTKNGIVNSIDALKMGELSVRLGAGRINKEDEIDYGVGIVIDKMVGDMVNTDDVLLRLFVKYDYVVDFDVNDIYLIS